MMSENKTEQIRRKIMMKFLRTLVWIDDEIRPDQTERLGDLFRSFFYPTAQRFQNQGLLVHLHPYAPDASEDENDTFTNNSSESFESATRLAQKADVVVLDWHLGRKDPQNSIRLLEELRAESAIRYIVVLSKYADRFEREMKQGRMIAGSSAASDDVHLFRSEGDAWVNDLGTHIIVMKKPEIADMSEANINTELKDFSESIFERIYALMSTANPDYLHWTAIEIAAKLRHSIPGWIQAIPSGTDAAVLSEMISQHTEARDFIPEHLLEDLSHISRLHDLESLASENCRPNHWTNNSYDIHEISDESESYKKFFHFSYGASKIEKKDAQSIDNHSAEDECRSFIESQQFFGEFCENISSSREPFPTFGAVYVRDQAEGTLAGNGGAGSTEASIIYLCLSQECDSLRSDSLIVLEGSVANSSSNNERVTKLSFQGKVFGFLPEAKYLQPATVPSESNGYKERRLNGYKKIGQLRKASARRILHQFWNHMSRSAVNLPRFTLKGRDGE